MLEKYVLGKKEVKIALEQNSTENNLRNVFNTINIKYNGFGEMNKPDFSKMEECINFINKELRAYEDDFRIILIEKDEYGGGIDYNKTRIDNMRTALTGLKNKIEEAELLIKSDELLYGPFKKQITSAKEVVDILKNI